MKQLRNTIKNNRYNRIGFLNALSSITEPEPHHFGEAVAGAVTRCGSGSNSSD
jgi:hypothetical protein